MLKCNENYMERYIGLDSGSFYYNTINLTMEEVNRIASQKIFIQSSAVVAADSIVKFIFNTNSLDQMSI